MALPRFAVFKSKNNGKYLNYIKDEGEMHGFVRFSGEEVVSPYAKYAIETAKSGNNGGLVNIRCCYNNKYWTRLGSTTNWIIAGADQPEEDQSKSTCTLFEPVFLDQNDSNTIRLRHVQLGNYACLWRGGYYACLLANSSSPDADSCDVFTITDWESLLILPKHVAFKGNNGKYLSACVIDGNPYMQFTSDDSGDQRVGNEITTLGDGSIRIKSDYFGKFWRLSPDTSGDVLPESQTNWILVDSDETSSNNLQTVFWPIKLDNNVLALRNLGNKYFCGIGEDSHGHVELNGCIKASSPGIVAEAQLEVEELVLTRSIYNVNYRLDDSRIYSERILTMGNGVAINRSEKDETLEVSFKSTETVTKFWNASLSLKLGASATFEAGVPFIINEKITISANVSSDYQWGETDEQTTTTGCKYSVTVPPMTMTTVSYIATQGTCDIPFSYTQRDTLTNGEQITTTMDDGLYTGINCYNMHYQHTEEKL